MPRKIRGRWQKENKTSGHADVLLFREMLLGRMTAQIRKEAENN